MESLYFKLNENSDLSTLVLNKILLSKRLLIEHVECIETCLETSAGLLKPQTRENLTSSFCKTIISALGVALSAKYIPKEKLLLRTTLSVVFGGLSVFCVIKNCIRIRHKLIRNSLDDFIKSLEAFSNCIERNILYFNEIQMMNSLNKTNNYIEYRQTEKVWNCIKAIKEITKLLYDTTRQLEDNYELSMDIADLYCPMEDLQDCDYYKNDVTTFTSKSIKDFYNIFVYVQSQYLFRLGLLAIQNFQMNFLNHDLPLLTKQIQKAIQDDEKYFKILSSEKKKQNPIEISSLNRSIPYHQHHSNIEPASILRNSSLKLSSCIYAVAEECQKLDDVLQRISENTKENETNNLMEISNSMRSIENSLSVCCDDFHRLILVYNKFLTDKLKLETKKDSNKEQDKSEENDNKLMESDEEQSIEECGDDDFFAFIEEKNLEKEMQEVVDDTSQIYNIDEKLTKKKFRPVLKQLRDKIGPIRNEMLEKERKILESKGIDVNKFLPEMNETESNGSDSDGSFEELEKERKQKIRKDNYEEMRKFLAQKETINIFALQIPAENALSEEILE